MKIYGLIGYPLGHSFSKSYFTEKFDREGIQAALYENFPLTQIDDFPELLANNNLAGLNVTIPYKESVMQFLDGFSTEAREINAVNVIEFREDKTLVGHNTDWLGFYRSIPGDFHERAANRVAVVLGTGGSSKAIRFALQKMNYEIHLVSRGSASAGWTYQTLPDEILSSASIIINTTPLGMYPKVQAFPQINYEVLSSDQLLYDLVYNPSITRFLEFGRQQGAQIRNGREMLEIQAEASWDIWQETKSNII